MSDIKTTSNEYLNNKDIFKDICLWKLKLYAFEDKNIKLPDSIGDGIAKTSEGLSKHAKFNRYWFRDEMVADGIENIIKRMYNFNEQLYMNPHGYISMSCENTFLQRKEKEDLQELVICKYYIENIHDEFESQGLTNKQVDEEFIQDMIDRKESIEKSIENKKKRRKLQKMKRNLSPIVGFIINTEDDIEEEINEKLKETDNFYNKETITMGERGKMMIRIEDIKRELGVESKKVLEVSDVVDYLVNIRKMPLNENKSRGIHKYLRIDFIEYELSDFVEVEWT